MDSVSYSSVEDYGSGNDFLKNELIDVHSELQELNDKLKDEYQILRDKMRLMRERESVLTAAEEKFEATLERHVNERLQAIKLHEGQDTVKLIKENKRLKCNFETLKSTNDVLKDELDRLKSQHERLEKRTMSIQARFLNLQKCNAQQRRKEASIQKFGNKSPPTAPQEAREEKRKFVFKMDNNSLDILNILLDWIITSQLKPTLGTIGDKIEPSALRNVLIQENSIKIIPTLVELIRTQQDKDGAIILSSLQFIFWAITLLNNSEDSKNLFPSTMRRLGDELYKSSSTGSGGPVAKNAQRPAFIESADINIRFVSALIILRTTNQADVLARVFDTLLNLLQTVEGKELFLYYNATQMFYPLLRPNSKLLTSLCLDVYMMMLHDGPAQSGFLQSCSNEKFFHVISLLLRMPGIETKEAEKISIILQKLSKLRCNKRLFDSFGIHNFVQEKIRSNADNVFLNVNLKSILLNINTKSS